MQVVKDSSEAGTYGYDYLDRRVWRSVDATGAQTHYIFDEAGHLLAEHDATTGNVLKEYVWIGDVPVAVVDSTSGSPITYYITTGRQNEPQQLIDGSGTAPTRTPGAGPRPSRPRRLTST